MKFVVFFIFLSLYFVGTSDEIDDYYSTALKLINNREFEEAHQYLDSIYKLTNNEIFYYERAVIFYRQKDFLSAIKILEDLVSRDEPKVKYYQLLGSCYDFEAQKTKSINILNEGLYKYPNAGELYYELGVTKIGMQERQEAADIWEKGIYMDPKYDRNYYQLTKFYRSTDFKVVSLFYGEIFMNISHDDEKKQEMSGILYNIYENVLNTYKKDGEIRFTKFYKKYEIKEAVESPFLFKFQEIATKILKEINTKDDVSIEMISNFRVKFLNYWDEQNLDEFYPNLIIEYQKRINELGLLDTYNYLLFSAGNIDEIKNYAYKNKDKIVKLTNWQNKNLLEITDENKYFSQKYKP